MLVHADLGLDTDEVKTVYVEGMINLRTNGGSSGILTSFLNFLGCGYSALVYLCKTAR